MAPAMRRFISSGQGHRCFPCAAGLDVSDRDPLVVGGQGAGQCGGGVAVHQHEVGLFHRQHRAQTLQHVRGEIREILPGLHQVQVVIRPDVEQLQDLVQHLPVLRGHADAGIHTLGALQGLDHRGHLDGLRARAEDNATSASIAAIHRPSGYILGVGVTTTPASLIRAGRSSCGTNPKKTTC
jgi:hypothetical protein